jgi:hypothetical protein
LFELRVRILFATNILMSSALAIDAIRKNAVIKKNFKKDFAKNSIKAN